jgi:cell division topological specificity factor
MSIFDYFRPKSTTSASLAKERLQIIVAHQRGRRIDFLPLLQKELLMVIAKYVPIDPEQVKIDLDRHGDTSVLELNVVLPNATQGTLEKQGTFDIID